MIALRISKGMRKAERKRRFSSLPHRSAAADITLNKLICQKEREHTLY